MKTSEMFSRSLYGLALKQNILTNVQNDHNKKSKTVCLLLLKMDNTAEKI